MSRRIAALKPQLNRIRAWAHEGSTDAWIAHQLETSAEAVRAFRLEHGIERGGPAPLAPITPDSVVEAMLAEEAAALEGPEPEPEREPADTPVRAPRRRTRQRAVDDAVEGPEVAAPAEATPGQDATEAAEAADAPARSGRRRGARGGSGRTAATSAEPEAAQAVEPAVEPEAAQVVEPEAEPAPQADREAASAEPPPDEEPSRSGRKRGRRRGRGRGGSRGLEARLLSGSVLLLDIAVTADATFQEHWQDAGPLRVEVSAETIVLRRVTADAEPERLDR
jgi:hypothetical protein